MYYEYWGLQKPPFDNVPDPAMYVDCHASLENAIAETLFAVEEGNECIAVILGDAGLGKTLSLRILIDSLDQEKYRIALVTNPGISFVQLMREIIGQLTGEICEEGKKAGVLEIFNSLIFEAERQGKKVLILIDEANAVTPANLESLRLLTNMQNDRRNLFTVVLSGQLDLARRLEHPKRANLFQRIGTYNRIGKIPSPETVRTYIETRLKLAGAGHPIFTEDAYPVFWEYSEQGIPRLINKIAKLCLKAGETNRMERIEGELVRQVGERFRSIFGPAAPKRRPRPRVPAGSEKVETASAAPGEASVPVPGGHTQFPPFSGETLHAETAEDGVTEEIEFGEIRLRIKIPADSFAEARSSDGKCLKLAGTIAVRVMKENPDLANGASTDPIAIWSSIRNILAGRLRRNPMPPPEPAVSAL